MRMFKTQCTCCGKPFEFPIQEIDAWEVIKLRAYRFGWTFYERKWYCQDCRPEQIKIIKGKHPRYYDYHDQWAGTHNSHEFEDEDYDPYADTMQHELCELCDYMHFGREDDGSHWAMCCVEDPNDHWGHNLYSGHFYGRPISGRFCPYFRCNTWCIIGLDCRDPVHDKERGKFHVPYNECYDGD